MLGEIEIKGRRLRDWVFKFFFMKIIILILIVIGIVIVENGKEKFNYIVVLFYL